MLPVPAVWIVHLSLACARAFTLHLPRVLQSESRLQPPGRVGRSNLWVPELIDD